MTTEIDRSHDISEPTAVSRSLGWIAAHFAHNKRYICDAWENRKVNTSEAVIDFVTTINSVFDQNPELVQESATGYPDSHYIDMRPFRMVKSVPGAHPSDSFYEIQAYEIIPHDSVDENPVKVSYIRLDKINGFSIKHACPEKPTTYGKIQPASVVSLLGSLHSHIDPNPNMIAAMAADRISRNE